MQVHGQEVRDVLAKRRQEHDKAEDLRRALERRLRLRRLNKDPVLSHDRSVCSTRLRARVCEACLVPFESCQASRLFSSLPCIGLIMPDYAIRGCMLNDTSSGRAEPAISSTAWPH